MLVDFIFVLAFRKLFLWLLCLIFPPLWEALQSSRTGGAIYQELLRKSPPRAIRPCLAHQYQNDESVHNREIFLQTRYCHFR